MFSLQDLPLERIRGKRILVLIDADVENAAPTVALLQSKGARVITATHLPPQIGTPAAKLSPEFVEHLSDALGRRVLKLDDVAGPEVIRTALNPPPPDQVVLLENLSLYPEDAVNDLGFARQLASLCDVFVNDAFDVAHRTMASNTGICRWVPIAVSGPKLASRVKEVQDFFDNPPRPFLAIVGGKAVPRKLELLYSLLPHLDRLFIGGSLAFSFLNAAGRETGRAAVETGFKRFIEDFASDARKHTQLVLPEDFLIRDGGSVRSVGTLCASDEPVDIGTHSLSQLSNLIAGAYGILWVDSLGVNSERQPAMSDWEILQQLCAAAPRRWQRALIAGQELVESLSMSPGSTQSQLSVYGEAALDIISKRPMPALEALHGDAIRPASRPRKRVLMPVDGSDHALEAARLLSRHVDVENAEIHLLYVHPSETAHEVWRDSSEIACLKAEAQMAGGAIFSPIERELGRYGLAVHHEVIRIGDPGDEVLKYADEIHAGLIVMGSHGRSKVLRLMLGSVSQRVVDDAACPVLIARIHTGNHERHHHRA
jgi:phosphoglycerate kinase